MKMTSLKYLNPFNQRYDAADNHQYPLARQQINRKEPFYPYAKGNYRHP